MWHYGANETKNTGKTAEGISLRSIFRGLGCAVATASVVVIGASNPASALPSFARQTGQPCGACHTDFPGLTPFGRQFKLGGYTLGGGDYQTTPFESSGDDSTATKALDSYAKKIVGKSAGKDKTTADAANSADSSYHGWVPPIAMMTIFGYTHRNTSLDSDAANPYNPNDNVRIEQFSLFWGGAITEHTGAFAQYTYEGAPVGKPLDPANPYAAYQWHWDNVDLRYANTGKVAGMDVTYGLSATNNPSMGDPWNTTPAWGFPYAAAGDLAPGPSAATLVDGGLGQQVAGLGGYAYFNNLVYVQLSGFQSLDHNTLAALGTNQFEAPGQIGGVAPYWRVAIEPHWGNNWWEFGTFGLAANVHPWTMALDPNGEYSNATYSQTDRYTDLGFDTQYQYQGDNYWVTLRGTYIHENQALDATFANGGSDNSSNTLNTVRLYGSLAYGNDNRVTLSGQYFDTWGSSDATLYADYASGNSPDSNGFTAEIAYIPFILGHPKVWPWANARVGLQYTWYNKFDGTTVGASDNNTLFAYLWVAM